MTGPQSQPRLDDALSHLERSQATLRRRVAQSMEINRRVDLLSVTGHSSDHTVTATVTATGRLVALDLADALRGRAPQEIARRVLSGVQQAQARIGDAVAQIVWSVVPADDPLGAEIVATYRKDHSPPEPVPAEAPPPVEPSDDDYGEPIMRRR